MKISKKYSHFFWGIIFFSILFLTFPLEARNDLLIFWLADKKEGEKIETYRYLFNLLEKYPQLCLNFSLSPPVLQTWSTAAPDLVEKLKSLQRKKQISIVFPPFYEPILPLIYGDNPVVSFSYPIDLREQIASSWELYQQIFDILPSGMVPPGGAISPAALDLLSEFEIKWILTGREQIQEEGYLPFVQYLTKESKEIYLFFRENNFSEYWEKLSFPEKYSLKIAPGKEKIEEWIAQIGEKNYPLTVVTFEGLTEFFSLQEKGYEILEQLFDQIVHGDFVTYTAEKYILKNRSAKKIEPFKLLTWRRDGFSAWTEKREKRAAWELLAEAREAIEKYKNSGQAEIKTLDTIFEEIYICESGDNFLCFGEYADEESEKNELLFRLRLINIYRLIGQPIPGELFHPLASYSFLGSLLSEEETEIEIDKNERLFSIVEPADDSLDERFDLKNFSCQERVTEVITSLGKEEIIFSFTFSKVIISTEVVTSTEVITSPEITFFPETIISGNTVSYTIKPSSPDEKSRWDLVPLREVITSTGVVVYRRESRKERIFLDLYIDLNNRVGAGSVTLLPGRKALTVPEDAWEYCLTMEINTPEVKEAKLYRAKENSPAEEVGKFPLVSTDPYTLSVAIPKEILYGTPMNWGYLVSVFKEVPVSPTTNSEGMKVIDLLVPLGKTQKQVLSESILTPHLSAIRIR